jgi:flagellin
MGFNSINTNTQAFAALQSLRQAQSGVLDASKRVQTGYRVADAADDAGVFSVAQGIRGELQALDEIIRTTAFARETVAVARKATEEMSSIIQEINTKVLVLRGGIDDPATKVAFQNDINSGIYRLDRVARGASMNGVALLTQADPAGSATFVPDGGTQDVTSVTTPTSTTSLGGTGAGTAPATINVAAPAYNPALTNPRVVITGTALFDPNSVTVSFSGATVASNPNGSFSITIPDTGGARAVSVAIGDNGLPSNGYSITGINYVYDTGPPVSTTTSVPTGSWVLPDPNGGSFKVINDPSGTSTSVLYSDLTSSGLGLDNPVYEPLDNLRQSVADAINRINTMMQHYAAKEREFAGNIANLQARTDALRQGLGATVDSDIGRAQALVLAEKAREQLSLQGLSIANRSQQAVARLLDGISR